PALLGHGNGETTRPGPEAVGGRGGEDGLYAGRPGGVVEPVRHGRAALANSSAGRGHAGGAGLLGGDNNGPGAGRRRGSTGSRGVRLGGAAAALAVPCRAVMGSRLLVNPGSPHRPS